MHLFIIFFLYFPDRISIKGIFWLYGSISFVGLIFVTIFVPENKGKNEAQLSEYFAKSKLKTTIIKSSAKNLHFGFGKIFTKLSFVFVFGFWNKGVINLSPTKFILS